ncbi:ANTAR domain-containing protein [Streptomyces dangxiongensis]|uniref:ANTAR domain-containing protein n=1 Tax=Streptomyces dangxiongensis TaxID=1442032 RepID=A0A3G2JL10_9ACTN|nr:ANTAR domain-containing protein [Streptomyces dangxiongensis]
MAFFAVSRNKPLVLLSTTDLVTEHHRLQEENEQLRRAVTSHAVIDQAIGVVVTLGRMAPEGAWRALRDVSQRTNTKLRTVAEHILDHAQGGPLPESERAELEKAIVRHRRCGGMPVTDGRAGSPGGAGSDGTTEAAAPTGPPPDPVRTAGR